jgi:hypothetical protein
MHGQAYHRHYGLERERLQQARAGRPCFRLRGDRDSVMVGDTAVWQSRFLQAALPAFQSQKVCFVGTRKWVNRLSHPRDPTAPMVVGLWKQYAAGFWNTRVLFISSVITSRFVRLMQPTVACIVFPVVHRSFAQTLSKTRSSPKPSSTSTSLELAIRSLAGTRLRQMTITS